MLAFCLGRGFLFHDDDGERDVDTFTRSLAAPSPLLSPSLPLLPAHSPLPRRKTHVDETGRARLAADGARGRRAHCVHWTETAAAALPKRRGGERSDDDNDGDDSVDTHTHHSRSQVAALKPSKMLVLIGGYSPATAAPVSDVLCIFHVNVRRGAVIFCV